MNKEIRIINFDNIKCNIIEKHVQGLIKCNDFCLKASNIKFVVENMFILNLH
jgi:hypothetical protein